MEHFCLKILLVDAPKCMYVRTYVWTRFITGCHRNEGFGVIFFFFCRNAWVPFLCKYWIKQKAGWVIDNGALTTLFDVRMYHTHTQQQSGEPPLISGCGRVQLYWMKIQQYT